MGFYIRKSISVGGLRFNFSKSGVGLSAGIKGFRVGTGPRGNYIHAGRNGFYYRKTIGDTNKPLRKVPDNPSLNSTKYNFKDIESGNISFMTDSTFDEVLDEINAKAAKFSFWILGLISLICAVFVNATAVILALVLTAVLYYFDLRRKRSYLIYDIEEDFESKMQKFYDAFDSLKKSRKIWHVASDARLNTDYDQKINAGASSLVNRSSIGISNGLPKNIISNVTVLTVPVGRQTLYFFPERILIEDKGKYGTINYRDLTIEYSNVRFIESESVPSDAEIVDHTWRFVNKKGGPDKRFNNNRQLPIVLYSKINFKSRSGLNEQIQASQKNVGIHLNSALIELAKGR